MRRALLCLPLGLAACGGEPLGGVGGGGGGIARLLAPASSAAPSAALKGTPRREVTVSGGAVTIRGPGGYCVDDTATRDRRDASFVMLAACRDLGLADAPGAPAAILTVTVGSAGSAEGVTAEAALSAASNGLFPRDANIVDGIAFAQMRSGGDEILPDVDPGHWRGAMIEGDRLLLLAVYGPAGSTVALTTGGALMLDLGRAIAAANPQPRATVVKAQTGTDTASPDATPATPGRAGPPAAPRGLGAALGALFN